jgi:phenylpropionate dioxygenase-like ring-hydroxylating dioxygenase large terminal subunit
VEQTRFGNEFSPQTNENIGVVRPRRPWPIVEAELAAGLRNEWYALLPSSDVGQRPVALRRLGEDLVLWRDAAGKLQLFRDSCAHRGARLSLGHATKTGLRCWYHGWVFDANGECVEVPSEGGCPLKGARVRSYPVEEHGGIVFGYLSEDGVVHPHTACPNPAELESPEWSGFIVPHLWNTTWFRILENLVDPLHAATLHSDTYTMGGGTDEDKIQVEDRPDGIFVTRAEQRQTSFDAVEFHFPNWCRLDIPYPWTAGPGGPMRILVFVTPVDADSTRVYMVRKRRITGLKWWLWAVLWSLRLKRKMYKAMDQDEAILVSQRGQQALESERLRQSDLGVARLRSLFLKRWNGKDETTQAAE